MRWDYNGAKDFGNPSPLDFQANSGFNNGKEVVMSEIQLSFEQLRQDIFESILRSLEENSYSGLHAALTYNQDPRLMVMPNIDSCMLMNHYGALILPYDIPNHPRLQLTIGLTMGRLTYTVHTHQEMAEACDFNRTMPALAAEIGLKCQSRAVNEGARYEFTNDPNLVWAPTTLNVLRAPHLEIAFKEFVRLQADRVISGVSEILAAHGFRKPMVDGSFCVAVFKKLGYDTEARAILEQVFDILSVDSRDPLNVLYSLKTKEQTTAPLLACREIESLLIGAGYTVTLQPCWGFEALHPSIVPTVTERVVYETQLIEKPVSELDWRSMIREPMID